MLAMHLAGAICKAGVAGGQNVVNP